MKRAVLILSDRLLTDFLKGFSSGDEYSLKIIKNQLPSDSKIIRAGHDAQGNICLVLESEEFEDILEGCKYPELEPPIIQRKVLDSVNG